MGKMNRNADYLLNQICEFYNKTGKPEIDPFEAGLKPEYDPYYTDLVANGYITEPSGITGEFRLLDRAINCARILK